MYSYKNIQPLNSKLEIITENKVLFKKRSNLRKVTMQRNDPRLMAYIRNRGTYYGEYG